MNDQHCNREPFIFVVAIAEFFSFREDWHQDDRVRRLVRQYQLTLDAALRDRSGWRKCAVPCRHCGIRFFTYPCNAGRLDLGCPFGCRLHNRRQLGNERSKKRYAKPEGRRNKKLLNAKRAKEAGNASPRVDASPSLVEQSMPQVRCDTPGASSPDAASVSEPAADGVLAPAAPTENLTLELDGFVLDEPTLVNSRILPYVRRVASVLERRTISREELIAALLGSMRQRSIARTPRREYVLRYLNQHPP